MFLVALRLGLTSFGGPVAHLGYFRREFVGARRWMDDATYADIVALCQTLPGPASSQVGMAVGLLRAGPLGLVAAWLGFTLPSAVLMAAIPLTLGSIGGALLPVSRVLQLVALAVVGLAVWRMARALAWDARRGAIALAAASFVLVFQEPWAQIAAIAIAGFVGWLAVPAPAVAAEASHPVPVSRGVALACGVLVLALLVVLPIARAAFPSTELGLVDAMYRSGALVFGGGHVVLPLLRAEVVPTGWVSESLFLAGYGAAQVVPGPLFTFAAYLGAIVSGVGGAILATLAIFLPGALLVVAALPSWGALRARGWARSALRGVNAAVVGLLLAALVALAASAMASFLR